MLRKSEPQRARDTSSCNNRRNNPRKHNIHNKQIVKNQCLIDFSIKHWMMTIREDDVGDDDNVGEMKVDK